MMQAETPAGPPGGGVDEIEEDDSEPPTPSSTQPAAAAPAEATDFDDVMKVCQQRRPAARCHATPPSRGTPAPTPPLRPCSRAACGARGARSSSRRTDARTRPSAPRSRRATPRSSPPSSCDRVPGGRSERVRCARERCTASLAHEWAMPQRCLRRRGGGRRRSVRVVRRPAPCGQCARAVGGDAGGARVLWTGPCSESHRDSRAAERERSEGPLDWTV
jgi:hypothetical protein